MTTIETVVPTGQRHNATALVRIDRIEEARDAAARLSGYLAAIVQLGKDALDAGSKESP